MTIFNKYIGLPYKNLGRSFDGVDCYGLLYLIYKTELKIELPTFLELEYSIDWYKKESESIITTNIYKAWKKVNRPFKKFDAIIFFDKYGSMASHIAVAIDSSKFIHIAETYNSKVNKLDNYWISRLYGGIRYNGINNI